MAWNDLIDNGIKSGYFNSIDKDRPYNAEDMTNYFEGLISDGVYASVGDQLEVKPGGGMSVTVGTGRAMIDCRWIRVTALQRLTLAAADTVSGRYDIVAVKLDLRKEYRQMTLELFENETDIPEDTDEEKYLALARIHIKANATSVAESDIEDLRKSKRCGYVTALNQVSGIGQKIAGGLSTTATSLNISGMCPNFDRKSDYLLVFKNGLFLTLNEDYKIEDDSTTVKLLKPNAGSQIEIVIIQGKHGEASAESSAGAETTEGGETT